MILSSAVPRIIQTGKIYVVALEQHRFFFAVRCVNELVSALQESLVGGELSHVEVGPVWFNEQVN